MLFYKLEELITNILNEFEGDDIKKIYLNILVEDSAKDSSEIQRRFKLVQNSLMTDNKGYNDLTTEVNAAVRKAFPSLDQTLKNRLLKPTMQQSFNTNPDGFQFISSQTYRRAGNGKELSRKSLTYILIYLCVKPSNWNEYDGSKRRKEKKQRNEHQKSSANFHVNSEHNSSLSKFFPELISTFLESIPKVKIDEGVYAKLSRYWYGYMLRPDDENPVMMRLPFIFDKASDYHLKVFCRSLNGNLFSGFGLLYGDYLVVTLTDKEKRRVINLQMYLKPSLASEELLLSSATLWIQKAGKPMLSIMLLDKATVFNEQDLPKVETINFNTEVGQNNYEKNEIKIIHNFIEYVARKNVPELAARYFGYFKRNAVELRNKVDAELHHRPWVEFDFLKQYLVEQNHLVEEQRKDGYWLSFSRIMSDEEAGQPVISVFHWEFQASNQRYIINVHRHSTHSGWSPYQGEVKYIDNHLVIYLTDKKSFKSYAAKLHSEEPLPYLLLGISSTLYGSKPIAVRELLVFTNQFDSKLETNGRILLDDFKALPFLDSESQKYLLDREKCTLTYD